MKKMFMCLIVTLMVVLQAYGAFAACCFSGGNCAEIVPPQLCGEQGGIYEPGSCTEPGVCDNGPATQAVPSMTQWGMIIFVTLAGLGAIYFIRRNKRTES